MTIDLQSSISKLLDNPKGKKFHFIGIGGISMSGLAYMLIDMGSIISGSDISINAHTEKLKSMGCNISIGHAESNITSVDIDAVIYTAAISVDNPEFALALKKQFLLIDRATLLGSIMKQYKQAITVSGTHGKSTTTSMLSSVYLSSKKDPSIHNGSNYDAIGGNIRIGKSDIFISEACEYKDSFLKFNPFIAIVLNVELDHVDYFKSKKQYLDSYSSFIDLIPKDGFVIACTDDPDMSYVISNKMCNIITYSIADVHCNYYASNIHFNSKGFGRYDLYRDGTFTAHVKLSVPGLHNISNSLACIACAVCSGCSIKHILHGILNFTGTSKRYEFIGQKNGVTVIDDYAHHPTEIAATINAARNCDCNDIWCVFQPHTYTRLSMFENDFAKALSLADKIVITEVYAARERKIRNVTPKTLCERLRMQNKEVVYMEDFDEIALYLDKGVNKNDMILLLGAGDVVKVADSFFQI